MNFEDEDDYPIVVCPGCDKKQPDYDGFGLLFCEHCGYCKHPAKTLRDHKWVCDVCNCITRSE
jgi:hypothetical protein